MQNWGDYLDDMPEIGESADFYEYAWLRLLLCEVLLFQLFGVRLNYQIS